MLDGNRHGDAILAVAERQVAAMRDGHTDACLAQYTEDAILLPPNLLPKAGAELQSWMSEFLQRFRVEWLSFIHDEIAASGDLAYHRYSYTWRVTSRDGGAVTVASGKGVQLLRRTSDGGWRIAREIWNANPAA